MGCWLCVIRDHFKHKDSIFILSGTIYFGTKAFGLKLKEILEPCHRQRICMVSSYEKSKPHGLMKGSGTHTTSRINAGLSLPFVKLKFDCNNVKANNKLDVILFYEFVITIEVVY